MRRTRETIVCKIYDLTPMDRIVGGTVLGALKAVDDLTVKSVEEADMGKFAITLFRVGTIFVNGDQMVEVVAREDDLR